VNYSELLQLAKGWGNFKFYRGIIWRLQSNNMFFSIKASKIFNNDRYILNSSYYIVVVFIDPLQGLYAILYGDTVDWFQFPTT